jgi:hypothetical protein
MESHQEQKMAGRSPVHDRPYPVPATAIKVEMTG